MRKPDGYAISRAGNETLAWQEQGDGAGTVHYTSAKVELLRAYGGKRTIIYSSPIPASGPQRPQRTRPVPVEGGQKPFPLYADETEPW